MAHLNADSFLSVEQRLQLEKALSDKRRDDELNEMEDGGKADAAGQKSNKPSVLDIDPWENGGLMFLRRPSTDKSPAKQGATYEDGKLNAKQHLHLKDRDRRPSLERADSLAADKGNYVPVAYSQSSAARAQSHHSSHNKKRSEKKSIRSKGFWKGLVSSPGDSKHYLDEKDPNYDPDEDVQHYNYREYSGPKGGSNGSEDGKTFDKGSEEEMKHFKSRVELDLQEFLLCGDMVDFRWSVEELATPELNHLLVKKAVLLGLGRSQREREMISQLFSFLYPKVLTAEQFFTGFENVLYSLDDILLDHPQAVHFVSLFMARAVIDDILPPSFSQKVRAKMADGCGGGDGVDAELVQGALNCVDTHINHRHATERLLRCWGSGAGRDIDATKLSMHGLLNEYNTSQDVEEASHCLSSLKVPFFHHECVKQAVVMMLEEESIQTKMMGLLKKLSETGLISDHQMSTGFHRVKQRLPDLELDIPKASVKFDKVMQEASACGVLAGIPAGDGHSQAPEGPPSGAEDKLDASFLAFREAATNLLVEYFNSGDAAEAIVSLRQLDQSQYCGWFVKRALTLAMDRRPKDKEMVCILLCDMYNDVLAMKDVEKGFTLLLDNMDDLILDVPDVVTQCALFLARTIVDDLAQPRFIEKAIRDSETNSASLECLTYCAQLLAARHAAERLHRCWGVGARATADEHKEKMKKILEEYLLSEDVAEASKCLRDLSATYFHHEFVKLGLIMVLEKKGEAEKQLMKLLGELSSTGQLSENQIQMGFQRVTNNLDDLCLDYPDAREKVMECVEVAKAQGWLVQSSQ
ncbi:MA3 domain-containing translation regulatory factor [Chloropicon primus]|uniref:MI domain-containing protein n=2 Tax=Chloropicon primus TaxID=1764295 RepID=A0A5B8MVG3_9CHLO|nr:hypothetical protein A3770_12p67540 [Chloropicon primus]UPR03443.1 MA3 domain-containing translation regulatory factor [Chloropicon primus]|mmetsp:Transcript_5578/g.16946  ORF Transcript_5578/g.16946 Transcript_5578/m.16946 type:complete len:808 (+) Transcript_5578:233-2656(+)|eukprot:QDZ24236.1 hypothetical protein A3770_12p67540 [Chloropicon primus]